MKLDGPPGTIGSCSRAVWASTPLTASALLDAFLGLNSREIQYSIPNHVEACEDQSSLFVIFVVEQVATWVLGKRSPLWGPQGHSRCLLDLSTCECFWYIETLLSSMTWKLLADSPLEWWLMVVRETSWGFVTVFGSSVLRIGTIRDFYTIKGQSK